MFTATVGLHDGLPHQVRSLIAIRPLLQSACNSLLLNGLPVDLTRAALAPRTRCAECASHLTTSDCMLSVPPIPPSLHAGADLVQHTMKLVLAEATTAAQLVQLGLRPTVVSALLTTAPPLPNSSVRAEPPQLRVQETFERVARGTGHGQVMLTALSSASVHWVGARCSGGVDKGQVGWAVRWTRGELAAGFGCVAARLDRVGLGRHALCIVVTSDGCATLRHAGGSRPLAWPPLQSGDTLGLHLDLQGTRAALLLTLNGTLRNVDGECFYDARGVDKAAIPLAPELSYHATLHPTVCLRRGPHCAEPAEATITLAAPLANALLHRRGFRPISQVLAAQRGGGRAVPMLGPPPHPPRRTHHDGGGGASQGACSAGHSSGGADGGGADGTTGAGGGGGAEGKYESDLPLEALLWEQFASLMGATPHLVSCTVHAWWRDMLPKAEPASLAAVECVICCAPLIDAEARNRKPRAGQEPVGTVCGHRYHSACIFRWLAADEHWEGPTCPCCRTVLHPTRDVRPLGIETAALAQITNTHEGVVEAGRDMQSVVIDV